MAEESFMLVSLKENEAKQLAQVISNDTSRKILDYLSNRKDATETKISEGLKLALSTVHYNLQALVKAKLVAVDEFHYSKKGKEVNHYSLANKYVIIAPKNTPESLKDKLRKILPVGIIAFGAAFVLRLLQPSKRIMQTFEAPMIKAAVDTSEGVAVPEALRTAVPEAADSVFGVMMPSIWESLAFWFLLGCVFTIIVFLIVDFIQRRK